MAMNLVEKKGPHWVTMRESHLEWQKVGCWVVKMAHCLVLLMAMNSAEKKGPHWVFYLELTKVYSKAHGWVSSMARN
eukprot:scaffold29690_cov59-Attheya_sp.AAC.2